MKKVVKFGGSSLADAEQFQKVKAIVQDEDVRRYVIPSAPGKRHDNDTKVTDLLYLCYEQVEAGENFKELLSTIQERYEAIIRDLDLDLSLAREFEKIKEQFLKKAGADYAASRGEYLNGIILANYLGIPFVDAADVICFRKDGSLDEDKTDAFLYERLSNLEYAVIPGFYGKAHGGGVKTFSRGGSDITGALVAKAVRADVYENWTDVPGFLVADPRVVDNPQVIETITYRELRELAYMGATVLHDEAIFPVRQANIPINIRNTNAPKGKGTLIVGSTCIRPKYTITGIAGRKGFVAINIDKAMMNAEIGFGRKVLQVFEDNGMSFEHMPSGIDTMTVFVHQEEFEHQEQRIIAALYRSVEPDELEVEPDLALIAVVGRGMRATRGTAGRIFSALAHARVNVKMIDQGSSELNVIIGVRNEEYERAVQAIYDIFVTAGIEVLP
ncbi:aspartokinase [Clostridia bacterium]|nr:aspartokinase [Clostridia bacterium]